MDLLSVFHIFFVVYYAAPLLLYHIYPTANGWNYAIRHEAAYNSPVVFLVICMSWVSIITAYYIAGFSGRADSSKWTVELTRKDNQLMRGLILLSLLLIGLFALSTALHGGLDAYVRTAVDRRSGGGGTLAEYLGYFFGVMPLLGVVLIAFGRGLHVRRLSRQILYILGIVVVILGAVRAIGIAGRGQMILSLDPLFVYFASCMRPSASRYFLAAIAAVFFLSFAIWIGNYGRLYLIAYQSAGEVSELAVIAERLYEANVGGSGIINALISFVGESDHFVVGTYRVLMNPGEFQSPRLMADYIRSLFAIIPGVSIYDLDVFVSGTLASINRDAIGFNGYVPVGYIGNVLANGGPVLLVAWSAVAGWVGGKLDRALRCNGALGVGGGIYVFVAFLWYEIFFHFDATQILTPLLGHYLLLALILLYVQVRVQRHQKCYREG